MSTARPFAYNTGSTISGTEQIGNLAIGYPDNGFDSTGINWRNGPDEDLGYVIARQIPSGNQPAPDGLNAYVAFWRTSAKTDEDFVNLVNKKFNQTFITGLQAENYLETNGYWTSWPGQIPQGMVLFLDAGNSQSYSGTGTVWYDLSGYGNHGSLSGATYASDNGGTMVFDGINDAITFNNPIEIPIANEDYTISVWFNSDEMPSIRGFIGWGAFGNVNQVNAWRLQTFAGGATGFVHYWWGNDLSFQTPLSANTWYNAVVAYSNGSRKIYLNNVQVAEDFPTGHNVPYSTNLRVGVTYDGFNEWFDGKIAQVIIYKRQATPSEIESIWNSGKYRFGYGTTPTPTPTPTITTTSTPTPTITPTNTPTPSTSPIPLTGYPFNLVALPYNFPSSGNSIMNGAGGSTSGSTNVNELSTSGRGFYFNSIDANSVDRTNYYSAFTGQSVTITLSQGSNTAIYSGDTNSFKQWIQVPEGSGFVFGTGIGVPPSGNPSGIATLIQSATTLFTIGVPVYVSLVINPDVTPTPTITTTSTPTPTNTSSPTPTNTPSPTPSLTPTQTITPTNTQTGTLTPTPTITQTPTSTPLLTSVSYLVIGGGAGGGANWGGGGGAGQVVTGTTSLSKNVTYTITVGNGGSGATSGQGSDGGTTTFSGTSLSVSAIGGGGGGYNVGPTTGTNGSDGASGGGGGGGGGARSTGGTGLAGFNGGSVTIDNSGSGGGGGSSQAGANGTSPSGVGNGGNGGNGTTFNITGSAVVYAGGGGGGGDAGSVAATGGTGGGGNGGNTNSGAGSNATGYGSGGGGGATNGGSGGNGSPGVVILSVPTNQLGTYTGSPIVGTNGLNTVLTFSGDGSYTATSIAPTSTPTPTPTTPFSVTGGTGTAVAFTSGTYFNAFTSASGVTTTDAFNTNSGAWQLYYSHSAVTINSGSNRIGLNSYTSGSNSWTWYVAISNSSNTIGNWGSVSAITNSQSFTYAAGGFNQSNITQTFTIPANRYFLIANSGGPFFRTIKTLDSNRTAQIDGTNYITVCNKVALGNNIGGGTTTIPVQFGGSGTGYQFYSGASHVHSVVFG